jgi:capsular exopolysaccharide synthesis family protein
LSERIAKTFRQTEQIQDATRLPVVGSVPRVKNGRTALVEVLRHQDSPYTQSLRDLYGRLQAADRKNPPRIIAIGSAVAAEGRSILAASLGRLLAGQGKRVLLIDCDWRHPDQHRLFRVPNETGLISLLMDEPIPLDDLIRTDALSGLDIITFGRRERQPGRLLLADRMRQILATVTKSYELVILDIPPVLSATEALSLSRRADKVIFAVRWRHTQRNTSLSALKRLVNARGDVAGIALIQVDSNRYRL